MSYIFILYLFYTILYFINTSHIKIPFKIQDYTYGEGENLILKYIYKDIFTKFLVGSPPQEVHLSLSFGEYSTFIISKNTDDFEGATFDFNLSKTYSAISSEPISFYFQSYTTAIKSKDNFIIKGTDIQINDLTFNLATELKQNNFYFTHSEILIQPGILGMLIAQVKNFEEEIYDVNFIEQLKSKNLISSYDFYFDFNDKNSGNIMIGSKPEEFDDIKYIRNNYVTMKTSSSNGDLDWSIKFDQVFYGEKKLEHIKPMLLRIEFGLITGYYEWEYALINEFFSKLISENKCFKKNSNDLGSYIHYFYCNKNTDLSGFKPFIFTINEFNYNFTLTKDDLFLDIGDKYLFLMAFGGISDLILGLPFLKKYQLIFNQNTKIIGFYLDKKEDNSGFLSILRNYIIIISILSCILMSLIVIAVLFFWKKKKNKQNATELLDDQFNENKINKENKIIEENENENESYIN